MSNFNWNKTSNPLQLFSETQFNFLTYILGNWVCVACDQTGENIVAINQYLPLNNIFISNNQGNNWTNITTPLGNINLAQVAITSNAETLCLAAVYHAVYVSNNSGQTWNQYLTNDDVRNCIACSSDGQYIITVQGGIQKLSISSDNGFTFNIFPGINIPNIDSIFWNSVAINSDGTIATACSSNSVCVILYPNTNNWFQANLPLYEWNSISMDSTGNNIVICCLNGYIYISTNTGNSWNSCAPSKLIWNNVVISRNANIIFATALNSNYIYYSTNNGSSWSTTFPNPNSSNWGSICCNNDGSIVYACINGGYIYVGTS